MRGILYYILHICCFSSLITAVPDIPQQPLRTSTEDGDPFTSAFDAFVRQTLEEFHVPGLSIAVVDNGTISSKGYGYAILPHQNATGDTLYFTGSTTKAFTAAAMALLVHDESYPEIQWSSPISDFIREDFVLANEYLTNHITIEDALSHRTGLPAHDRSYGYPHDTLSSVVQRMRYLPFTAEPRTKFQYNNLMFAVMADLLETVTGQKLEAILRDNFWEPLGMRSTSFTIPKASGEDCKLARGYYWDPAQDSDTQSSQNGQYIPEPYLDLLPISGAGAIVSSVNDYALWARALLDAARTTDTVSNSNQSILHKIFRDTTTPRTITDETGLVGPVFILYGLGWYIADLLGEPLIFHSGGLTGFGTMLFMLPDRDYAVITMGNTQGTSGLAGGLILTELIKEKLDLRADVTLVQNALLELEKTGRRSSASTYRQRRSSRVSLAPSTEYLPLPRPLEDFVGTYSHPAYGILNISVASISGAVEAEKVLEGLLDHRTWPEKERFTHITSTLFSVRSLHPHGLGNISTGEGIVWETIDDFPDDERIAQAYFELARDGMDVARVGVELEEEMILSARSKGEHYWRDGMIWFEKM